MSIINKLDISLILLCKKDAFNTKTILSMLLSIPFLFRKIFNTLVDLLKRKKGFVSVVTSQDHITSNQFEFCTLYIIYTCGGVSVYPTLIIIIISSFFFYAARFYLIFFIQFEIHLHVMFAKKNF